MRPASVASYRHHLSRFEAYLHWAGVGGLSELSAVLLSAFTAERSAAGLAKTAVREGCGVLRVFLRYAAREGLVGGELWKTVEWPQVYRLADIRGRSHGRKSARSGLRLTAALQSAGGITPS